MPNVSRIGDVVNGICCGHSGCIPTTGIIVQGSPTVLNGTGIGRLNDTVSLNCGHTSQVMGGSATVLVTGLGAARIGDVVVGGPFSGTIVGGSPNVIVGG